MRAVIVQVDETIQAVTVVNTQAEAEVAVGQLREQIAEAGSAAEGFRAFEVNVDRIDDVMGYCIPTRDDSDTV